MMGIMVCWIGYLIQKMIKKQQHALQQQQNDFKDSQINNLKTIQESLAQGLNSIHEQLRTVLSQQSTHLSSHIDKLTRTTEDRLKEISGYVDRRLGEGFEKTTATFTSVVERLTQIDAAQKKLSELSVNVDNLQRVLSDKRSRGAFGEVQLSALIRNMLPPANYTMQYTLPNNKRCDCILFLPEPTGNIAVDAKFPLESYRKIHNDGISSLERKEAQRHFKEDIKKHIRDIAEKYIIAGETADGAIMFIPAEAIFADIHAQHPELIEYAYKMRVWLASPTTMMAILTTASAVLKDAATRKQVNIIQEHLIALSKDFTRFEKRMDSLSKHIRQVHEDVDQVQTSSKKITGRFNKIEKVELNNIDQTFLIEK